MKVHPKGQYLEEVGLDLKQWVRNQKQKNKTLATLFVSKHGKISIVLTTGQSKIILFI